MKKVINKRRSDQIFVSAIVPIFNEEKTVKRVVKTLLKCNLIEEVICINDGSSDKSLSKLSEFKENIILINLKRNHGKGYAMAKGVKKSKGKIIAFIDADLTNLNNKHLELLLLPIINNKAKAVLGYLSRNRYFPNIFSQLSGERAYFKKDLLPHLKPMAEARFGVEVFLNNIFKNKIKKVHLAGLKGLLKYEKRLPQQAVKEYLNEAVEIAHEIGKREGLLPEDTRIINQLVQAVNFSDLKGRVQKIRNADIRLILEEYVLKIMKRFRNIKYF
jgi:glycosyltransferase involved in cell wall biosynthesis